MFPHKQDVLFCCLVLRKCSILKCRDPESHLCYKQLHLCCLKTSFQVWEHLLICYTFCLSEQDRLSYLSVQNEDLNAQFVFEVSDISTI